LHGPDAATHTENVGDPDAFDQTCAGVRHLVRLAPSSIDLGAKFTLTRSNQDKLFETATLIENLGLRRLDVQVLTPFGPATPSIAPALDTAAREISRPLAAFEGRLQPRVSTLPLCFLPGHEDAVIGDDLELAGRITTADTDVDP